MTTLQEAQFEAVKNDLENLQKHRELVNLHMVHQSAQIERQTAALESIANSLRVLRGFYENPR